MREVQYLIAGALSMVPLEVSASLQLITNIFTGNTKDFIVYQSILCPDGIIASLKGGWSGRRHDAAMFAEYRLDFLVPVVAKGGYRYSDGTIYVGTWNTEGKRQGEGHMLFPDGTRYDGCFENGLFNGNGVLTFADGAKYEGEFLQGWFHGYGIFWRADSTRHEGDFRGGKIWGLGKKIRQEMSQTIERNFVGLTTFNDNSHGFPRNEGFFQDCLLKKLIKCPDVIQKAQKIAYMARNLYITNTKL